MTDFDDSQFFADFKKACGDENPRIQVSGTASNDTAGSFRLFSDQDIFSFIFGGGLKKVTYKNAEPWRNAPPAEAPLPVHVYNFVCGTTRKKGYLSIAYMPKRNLWKLKSFKEFDIKQELRVLRGRL